MKTKLAIIVPSLRGGGAERVVTNIVSNINKNKFDITLILVKKEGPYINLIPENVSIVDLDSDRVRYSIFKLIRELNYCKPDVVLSTLGHLNLALLIIRPLLKGNPKIIIREANTPSKSLSKLSSIRKIIFRYLYKKLYPKTDLIIAQCKDMKNDIIETFNIDRNKIQYIYNPLDIENIRKNMKDKNPYDQNKINLLAVGRLTYQKGYDVLINAFNIVANNIPNVTLTILGDGELKEELQNQADKLGILDKISFTGFKDNPYPYYYYGDTYILSSRWEGFPNSLLEALACGCKVVSTDCKSGPREILEDNEYGILVPTDDYISLSEGIIKSINSENKSRDRAKMFDINKIIKEYEKVFIK
ncbi:glycosyltransferase [Garciella nitratireducens]|uniref:glycosyltransferase n=1 Tax=Garciella nitratireducens TaxID=218205 RepID=UPI0015F0E1EF|nr:glycosyltransferase [Garciella nitratireducens]